jgi:hypothetical protein
VTGRFAWLSQDADLSQTTLDEEKRARELVDDDLAGHKQQTSGCLEPFLEAYLGEH